MLGMFDKNAIIFDPDRPGVESFAPVVTLRLEDLPEDPEAAGSNPVIQILGVDYVVEQRTKDGPTGGSIRLLLHVAP